jgi:NADH:ubiquinone oxidoreductase subunit
MPFGTWLYTKFFGILVGCDRHGNKYYKSTTKNGEHVGRYGTERRWVIYKGQAEPTKIPPCWHSWMHHMRVEPPTEEELKSWYDWEKPFIPNLSGTKAAFLPSGITGRRDKATGDYTPWKPS